MPEDDVFLRMLVDEADVDEFDRPVRDAEAAGASDDELAAIRRRSMLALQVRSVLGERRRREIELAALYETVRDLISIRDVETVLQAIARRARQLLDADTAYLTLIDDERGDTYMRVTDGMVTEDFKRIRLPLGVGLGGLVAQSNTPYFTSNYLEDPRFVHAGDIDGVVSGEELTAILGVPLTHGGEVSGVLFAANRQPRPFATHEVNLLASLAAHAAIALENARLFQESRDALEEVNQAHGLLRQRSSAVERAADVHARLTNIVLQGGSLDEVAVAVSTVMDGELVVVDAAGTVLSVVGRDDVAVGEAWPDPSLREGVRRAADSGRSVRVPAGWVAPVMGGSDLLGALLLTGAPTFSDADVRTLERAGQVTALVMLQRRAVAEAEQRSRGEFLDDLLDRPHRDVEALRRRAGMLGVDLDAPHVVCVAATDGPRPPLRACLDRIAARRVGSLTGVLHGTVVLVLGGDDPMAAAADLRAAVGTDGMEATVGVAGPARGPSGLVAAYVDADRCHRALLALGRAGQVACVDELGVHAQLFHASGRDAIDRFVTSTLGPVLDHDTRRGTELVATLEAYFDAGGNVTRAAEALHVHANTVHQRIERLSSLLGDGWRDPEPALRLHLAVQAHRLQTALD